MATNTNSMARQFQLIQVRPGEPDFEIFQLLHEQLYESGSPRFGAGHDPKDKHLAGCYLLFDEKRAVGRFAFYENPDLVFKGQKACCVGSYECVDENDTAHYLLTEAKKLAKSKGHKWLIGPMEGSTWESYRFSNYHQFSSFFTEPYHHLYYNNHFKDAGFEPIAQFTSNFSDNLKFDASEIEKTQSEYLKNGLTFRHLDMNNLWGDLKKIGQFSIEAFSQNFLYTPITVDEFVTKYASFQQVFDPDLVLIAEDSKQNIQAISFSLPNYSDPNRSSFILKSMARKVDSQFKGVSKFLTEKTYQIATSKGYDTAIHAFMIEENASNKISAQQYESSEYASYSLYGLEL